MARFLVACTPLQGHVTPLLAITRQLAQRGHEVTVCTGRRFADAVESHGAGHLPLPAEADYDDRDLEATFGRRRRRRLAQVNDDICQLLAGPLPHQHHAIEQLTADLRPSAVLVDSSFLGAFSWQAARGTHHPPLAVANITYLTIRGRGVPPPGPGFPPQGGTQGEARDALVRALTDRVLARRGRRQLERATAGVVGRPLPELLFDGPALADLLLVLTTPTLEYPRCDLPPSVRFVGPVRTPPEPFDPPPWWVELDGDRPVVHVTQGTMVNSDLGELIGPTFEALADDDVLVVATTGGRSPGAVPGRTPANARIAPYLPYDHLLARTDVMVTNGGYGGVQRALAAGVPLVVAGSGEDKPEIAARVEWSGAGVNLRTGRPRPNVLRQAVRRVLAEPGFRDRARAIRDEVAGDDGAATAADELEALVSVEPD